MPTITKEKLIEWYLKQGQTVEGADTGTTMLKKLFNKDDSSGGSYQRKKRKDVNTNGSGIASNYERTAVAEALEVFSIIEREIEKDIKEGKYILTDLNN